MAQEAIRMDTPGAPAAAPQATAETIDELAAAAFVEAVFVENHERIYRLVHASTRDEEVAADVTQEAFVRLLVEVRAGRLPENPGGWLYRTASNLVISRARRVSVARRLAPRLVRRDEERGPEELAVEHERSRAMEDALATLSATERVALIMAAQGSTGEEIAAHLGKTHGATRTMMSRARIRLHVAWQAVQEPVPGRPASLGGTVLLAAAR